MTTYDATRALSPARRTFQALASAPVVVWAYAAVIAAAACVGPLLDPWVGLLCQALLLVALLNHSALTEDRFGRQALLALALVPLLELFSAVAPMAELPAVAWYALVGVPLLPAVVLVVRLTGLPAPAVKRSWRAAAGQLAIAATGVPLSLAWFALVRPGPPVANFDLSGTPAALVLALVFAAVLEEVIFRWLFLQALGPVLGRAAALATAVLFASTFVATATAQTSPGLVPFMAVVGAFFAWCATSTRSIWGVALAHAVLNVGALVVWPLVVAGTPPAAVEPAPSTPVAVTTVAPAVVAAPPTVVAPPTSLPAAPVVAGTAPAFLAPTLVPAPAPNLVQSTPAVAPVEAPFCSPGQTASFVLGFASLKLQLGPAMGDPLECEHAATAEGDATQRTTTGLAYWRKTANLASFSSGSDHWALLANGLTHWTGPSDEPPDDLLAQPSNLDDDAAPAD